MGKTAMSVVRNQSYPKKGISIRERHNERENETYYNADIRQDRKNLNVYFKQSESSYAQTFDAMIADGTISVKGLKKDGTAKVFDEFVFDVNTEYFDHNGGYEYAKSFFEEAYRHSVKEIGGEQYILSAVMHADERNKALSEKLGRDVYHYHLHVIYVPVVDKEVCFSKDNKNPELAGKLKEVIKQVSHSKKWPRYKTEKGWVNSYSLLQDRFHDHMKEAGYIGFERGEQGSTAEHVSTEEYKAQKEKERAAEYTAVVEQKQEAAAVLDEKAEKKKKQLAELEAKTAVSKKEVATVEEIEKMVKPTLLGGNLQIAPADWKKVSNLAKEGVKSRGIIAGLKKQIEGFINKIKELMQKLKKYESMGVTDTMRYYEAKQKAPRRLSETVDNIMRNPPEKQAQKHKNHAINKNTSHEL